MPTLTYCKGLPTPADELNAIGFTEFEMFLTAYAPIFHKAVCETVTQLLSGSFNKSKWNTHLQQTYGISKRHANGVISSAKGSVDSAKECRKLHIKQLEGKLKSAKQWVKKSLKRIKRKDFYSACNLHTRRTRLQDLRFAIHHKKRRIAVLETQVKHLKAKAIQVTVPRSQCFVVGSKDESYGNQTVQWAGNTIKFRVPYCLESKFGKHVETKLGGFKRNINRIPSDGAKTWHFYRKDGKWVAAVQFTPSAVKRVSKHSMYGCIGIDLNPGSIGWAYADTDGNLKAHGQIPLQMGLPTGKQDAQIVDAVMQLVTLAKTYKCPIVAEKLDFSNKKTSLKEQGKKYARMLSGWAYSRFNELLDSICQNRGIRVLRVNPAYTSVIGLVKYSKQYGLASDESAALAIARRAMRLSERLPSSINAYLEVNSGKHIWSHWSQLNKQLKTKRVRRHTFYSISNWEFLDKRSKLHSC